MQKLQQIQRPFDFLEYKMGKEVLLQLKNSDGLIKGKLCAWDANLNVVLDIKGTHRFYRGDMIFWIE